MPAPTDGPTDLDALAASDPACLYGLELRYVLTDLMARTGRVWQVRDLVQTLVDAGFDIGEPPSRIVSGALRTEIARGRVVRTGWGRYRSAGSIPGSTRRRIRARASTRWARLHAHRPT